MKILVLTAIRSDYDLLSSLFKLLHNDDEIELKLLVSGAHLSKAFGYTKQYIQKDGLETLVEIETLINSDSKKSRLKTASLLLQNSIDIVSNFNPNIIIYAGDREDVMIGALLGTYLSIPTIHFYGGDHEEDGHQDTAIRHATSKLSSLHFVSTKEHKKRLLSLGESKKRIFNIGSISLDNLLNFNNLNIHDKLNRDIPDKFALLIFHPLQNENAKKIFSNILDVLKQKSIFAFVSYPNTDPGYEEIKKVISSYERDNNFYFYQNFERDIFLSIFKQCEFVIGNSSAGILEAGSFKKASINVGQRQLGRKCAANVVFCNVDKKSISNSVDEISATKFQQKLSKIKNPYGDGKSAKRAYNFIKELDFKSYLVKSEDPLKNNKS